MNVIVVDDEPLALRKTLSQVNSLPETGDVAGFESPQAALAWLAEHCADVAVLDVEMYGMNGIELAKACKDLNPEIRIVFLTGYSEYAVDAFRIHASGYLLKPASTEDIHQELLRLKESSIKPAARGVTIQTFGNFQVYSNGKHVLFRRNKSKEVLAYLVDRKGAGISAAEIAATLWEDRPYDRSLQNQVQMIISEMMRTLRDYDAAQIVIKKHNSLSVDIGAFSCDYYRFLSGDMDAINSFMGEYMSEYSWAEFTTGMLEERSR